jgi:hypothetical protein
VRLWCLLLSPGGVILVIVALPVALVLLHPDEGIRPQVTDPLESEFRLCFLLSFARVS